MFKAAVFNVFALGISLLTGTNSLFSPNKVLSVSTRSFHSTTKDSLGSGTSSISLAAPVRTGELCARIATAAKTSSSLYRMAVPARLAYDCWTSVLVKESTALGSVDAIEKMVQFQPKLAYLKKPPVEILAGLPDIRSKVSKERYSYHVRQIEGWIARRMSVELMELTV